MKILARSFRESLAFRLAFLYGLAVLLVMLVVAVTFYYGTVGVLAQGIDTQLGSLSVRLADLAGQQGSDGVAEEIDRLLSDGIASDTEIYLLARADGGKIAGNIASWDWSADPFGPLFDKDVLRLGVPTVARLRLVRLADGAVLAVGRDMPDQQEIRRLVTRALLGGGVAALMIAGFGGLLFHRRIEKRLAAIRGTAAKIESGQLDWRIPPSTARDEFSRLDIDINRMLDRIQQLMDGVRHVSNAIAHDLRTPLARLRARLDEAVRDENRTALPAAAQSAIAEIDQLTLLFERLLQIAEAESGTRRQSFAPVPLGELVSTFAEAYGVLAEQNGVSFTASLSEEATVLGDRALLSALLANLLENAFKYAGSASAEIALGLKICEEKAELWVRDRGPGIPPAERDKVLERFYRLDRSRSLPGNGLGLALVAAIVALHQGALSLDDASPGLLVRVQLPLAS